MGSNGRDTSESKLYKVTNYSSCTDHLFLLKRFLTIYFSNISFKCSTYTAEEVQYFWIF